LHLLERAFEGPQGDSMKLFLTAAFFLILISCGGNASTLTPTPAAPLEVVKTAVGTLIGTPVTQAIGSSGGNATVVSAGAKIVVPAGALPDGSSITVQAISNTLAGSGEGIQISGDAWSKPVTMQFSYPAGESNPNNFQIAIQQNDGSWITSKSAKVDAVNRTVSVRLGPDSSATVAANALKPNLKPMAKLNRHNIVMTKAFYLKPGSATVKLGGTATFAAYASVAVTEAAPSSQATTDDDELVPLAQPVISSQKPIDEEELTPLPKLRVVVREYPFTNAKAGFTRLWAVEGPGKIEASGTSSGLYTAPSDPASRGKTAKVYFTSFDAKGAVVIAGSVKIEDGPKSYEVFGADDGGTISGTICDTSKPSELTILGGGGISVSLYLTPTSDTTGSASDLYTVGSVTHQLSGTYTITHATDSSNGSLRVIGTITVTSPVGNLSKPTDFTAALTPIAACAPQ
jgi:hypothetical protein